MKNTQLQLRPYQVTDVDAIEEAWKTYRSILYQLPTGGGKSVVLSKLIGDYRNEKILILAHKRRLLTQMKGHLDRIGVKAGMLIAQREENLDSNVVIASIRTAVKSKRLEMLISRHWDRVIIDEARHSRTGSYDVVLDKLLEVHPTHKLLGVDATPYRKDKKRLDKHFQFMVKSCETIKSLQEKGFLAVEKTYATPIGDIEAQVKEVANDYQQTELSNYMRQPKYLNYVVDAYTKFGEKRQAIVFAVDKAHSKDLLAAFEDKYPTTRIARIDSDHSEEQIDQIYTDYENKKIQILINVEMLTEGVDLPETGCIVGARPTKSLVLYLQMCGRGTRPKKDESQLIVIDCAGWTEQFGTISSPKEWSLDPEVDPNDPRKKNRIVGRDKDGNLTTDKDQITEFSELVEMTPDQYIAKVQGGLKEAEKQNMTIDQKIKQVQNELAELLHKAALKGLKDKVSPFTCIVQSDPWDDEELNAYFFHKTRLTTKKARRSNEEIDAWTDGSQVVSMALKKRDLMFAKLDASNLEDYYGRQNKSALKEYREMAAVCGEVNSMIADNKNLMMQILDKYQQAHDLKKSKINLEEYKDLQKKFEHETWIQSIADHLKKDTTLIIGGVEASDYFKGYYRRQMIESITIPNGQINTHHNTILLNMTDRWNEKAPYTEEKKYIKGEKIYEILKSCGWKVPQAKLEAA